MRGAQGRYAHQKVLIKNLPFSDISKSGKDYFSTEKDVSGRQDAQRKREKFRCPRTSPARNSAAPAATRTISFPCPASLEEEAFEAGAGGCRFSLSLTILLILWKRRSLNPGKQSLRILRRKAELLGGEGNGSVMDAWKLPDLLFHFSRAVGASQIFQKVDLLWASVIGKLRGNFLLMVMLMAAGAAFLVFMMMFVVVLMAAGTAFLMFMMMLMVVLMAAGTAFSVFVVMLMMMSLLCVEIGAGTLRRSNTRFPVPMRWRFSGFPEGVNQDPLP